MKFNKGDLVITRKGNLAIIIEKDPKTHGYDYVDVLFCKTNVVRTGLHIGQIQRVIKK